MVLQECSTNLDWNKIIYHNDILKDNIKEAFTVLYILDIIDRGLIEIQILNDNVIYFIPNNFLYEFLNRTNFLIKNHLFYKVFSLYGYYSDISDVRREDKVYGYTLNSNFHSVLQSSYFRNKKPRIYYKNSSCEIVYYNVDKSNLAVFTSKETLRNYLQISASRVQIDLPKYKEVFKGIKNRQVYTGETYIDKIPPIYYSDRSFLGDFININDYLENKDKKLPQLLRILNQNEIASKQDGEFECGCGNKFITKLSYVAKGNTLSCGCHKGVSHGDTGTRLYTIWWGMKNRCAVKDNKDYPSYGGRGISVCVDWYDNYLSFKQWSLENGYSDSLSIDRINVDGNYCPENCRWTTATIQSQNTRLLSKVNTSGYRGVGLNKTNNKWKVSIGVNNKTIRLGTFKTALEGAIAYNNYVIENNLEHPLNIIPDEELFEPITDL